MKHGIQNELAKYANKFDPSVRYPTKSGFLKTTEHFIRAATNQNQKIMKEMPYANRRMLTTLLHPMRRASSAEK